jgi:hypothetical protein
MAGNLQTKATFPRSGWYNVAEGDRSLLVEEHPQRNAQHYQLYQAKEGRLELEGSALHLQDFCRPVELLLMDLQPVHLLFQHDDLALCPGV